MNTKTLALAVLILLATGVATLAGTDDKLKGYTWKSQVEVSLNGDLRSTKVYQVTALPDGTHQKTELSSDDAPGPRGPLRQRLAHKMEDREADWIEGLKTQLEGYSKLTPAQIEAFTKTAQITEVPDSKPPAVRVVGKGLVTPDDQVTMVVALQGDTKIPLEMHVQTAYDAQPVKLDVTFATLEGSIPYAAQTAMTIPSKSLVVTIQNSDYKKG